MPDGTFADVAGTVLDLREKTCVGDVLSQKDRLLDIVGGIDHCYSFENAAEEEKAWLYSPLSGITMKVYSDCEGMQVYSGNFLTGADVDRYGKELVSRSGICFEPQRYPDSINQPAFPGSHPPAGRNLSPVYPLPVWHRRIKEQSAEAFASALCFLF